MDLESEQFDDQMDHVSDSNSKSSEGDYELNSSEELKDSDTVTSGNESDDTVPDIDITPPSWTDKLNQLPCLSSSSKEDLCCLMISMSTLHILLITSNCFLQMDLLSTL